MAITSKEVIIILLGIIGSLIMGLLLKTTSLEIPRIKDYLIIFGVLIIVIIALVIVLYKRFNEIDKEFINQKLEQKKINERLKIYKRLSKIEEKVFKNGTKH